MKTCLDCKQEKPVNEFHKCKVKSDGLYPYCKPCRKIRQQEEYYKNKKKYAERSKKYRAKNQDKIRLKEAARERNPEVSRRYQLKRRFGITPEQYQELLDKQDGNCAVCGKHHSEFNKRLAVDHDHITSEIRGLLCFTCNHRVVGRHRDPELLQRAANYLREGTGLFVPAKKRRRHARK